MGHIVVRSTESVGDEERFTWTNDSLPKTSECPQKDISELLRVSFIFK